jgi:3-hydroxyisobutyryl-CoA hydrolase
VVGCKSVTLALTFPSLLQSGASPDFIAGVTAKLLTKPKANPTWSPAKLEDVAEDLVARFHQSKQAVGASKVQLHPTLRNNETPNPMTYALPTERLIQQLVEGSHISSASTAITLPELLSRLQAMKHHKNGIQEKVMDVVHRRIKQDSDGFLTWR